MKEGWKMVKLGEILKPSQNQVSVTPFENYPQIGIRLWGEGAYAREDVLGSATQYKFFYKAKKGDLTFNKIWVRNGAVTVIPESLNDFYVSPEFPVYHLEKDIVSPDWLHFLTKCKFFWDSCNEKAFGTSGKNRVKPSEFLQVEIPLPPLTEQRRIAGRLAALKGKIDEVRALRVEQERESGGLVYQTYLNCLQISEFSKPFGEIAPLIRREVEMDLEQKYPEVGVRSFGKGTFLKPALTGAEIGGKQIFQIRKGDLLISSVFAWEGAVAIAQQQDDGLFASHRFLSRIVNEDVVLPPFICYHLSKGLGLEDLQIACRGGAGRNRPISLSILDKIEIPVPPKSEQLRFVSLLHKMEQLKAAQAGQMAGLEGLFPAVLEKAFRGEW